MSMNRIHRAIALSTGCLSLVACTHEAPKGPQAAPVPVHSYRELELRENPRPLDPTAALDVRGVNADLDLLTYALEQAYSGQRFLPAADWARMTSQMALLRDKPATVESFCDAVGDALWQLPDAHLAAKRKSPLDGSMWRCGKLFRQAKREPSVGANYAAKEKTAPWVASSLDFGRSSVGVLAILHFAAKKDPAWGSFDAKVRELMKASALVIDLRGNGGGDDARGYELAETLLDGHVADGSIRQHRRTSPAALTLAANMYYASARRPDGTLAPFMQERYDEALKARDEAARASAPEWLVEDHPPVNVIAGPKAFSGPIAILIDSACGSSCESSLEVLREHPRAKVFGQRTSGFIHFGNVGHVALPTSHILVQLATTYNEYPNGKFYDKTGFEPDVPIKDGVNAFDAALTWLNDAIWLAPGRKK